MIRKHPEADAQRYSEIAIQKSALLALLVTILLFLVIKGDGLDVQPADEIDKMVTFDIPPEIQQQQQVKAPPRPSIPIETESDEVPEDVTIADTVIDTVWTPPPEPDANVEFFAYDEAPVPLVKPQPVYPSLARKAGIEGMVIVQVAIDVKGNVFQAKILKSVPGLDEAALAAARKYVFKPAMQRDRPVPVKIGIPITFSLR